MANEWAPQYAPWRHGGWYVTNVRYPSGACGCVSRNYADGKWRIVCSGSGPGEWADRTFPSRDAAARAEHELAVALGTGEKFYAVRQARTRVVGSRVMTYREAIEEVTVWRQEIGPAVVAPVSDELKRAVSSYDQAVLAPLLTAR